MYEREIAKHCKRSNKAIKYVHDHNASIHIPKLDCNSLRIIAYSDAAFAYNGDLSSQLGRTVLLTDDNHNSIQVSYKSRQIAPSVVSAGVISFADLFDDELAIRKQLEFVLRQPIPIHILTDSKSLFEIVSKPGLTS